MRTIIAACIASCVGNQQAGAEPAESSPAPALTPDGSLPPTLLHLLQNATDTDTPFATLCGAIAALQSSSAIADAIASDPSAAAALATLGQLSNFDPETSIAEPIFIS